MAVVSIYHYLDQVYWESSLDFEQFKTKLKSTQFTDKVAFSSPRPSIYSLVKKFGFTDAQYLEVIPYLSQKLSRRFWTQELLAYVKNVDIKAFNFNIIQLMRLLGARLTSSKEAVIETMKTLPVLEQLTALDNSLLQKDHQLHQFFSMQRGIFKRSSFKGSFHQLLKMRSGLKEQIIAHIKTQPAEKQLILINDCLKPGTALNALFKTQRGYRVVSPQRGTLKTLIDMQAKVSAIVPKDTSLRKRLLDIGFDLSQVPDELCCILFLDIMSEPIALGHGAYCDKKTLQKLFAKNPQEATFTCPATQQTLYKIGMLDNIDKAKQQECIDFVVKQEQAYQQRKQQEVLANQPIAEQISKDERFGMSM